MSVCKVSVVQINVFYSNKNKSFQNEDFLEDLYTVTPKVDETFKRMTKTAYVSEYVYIDSTYNFI